jgi:CubicO group peptidase (beta-lactamase class C family)
MSSVADAVEKLAHDTGFSGVVSVDHAGEVTFAKAYGLAHHSHGIANTIDTRFAIASGTKGLTALTVVSLIEQNVLSLSTTARSILGPDLPLIENAVTVEHLLAHRSGIGDYLDEGNGREISDYVLPVPIHTLATTEQYLSVLNGHPPKFAPGSQFSYCNSGYVVLALIAERAGGKPFHDLVAELVCEPAGMPDTEFLRPDELPARTATGYVTETRSNIFHLPVRGSGDGGIYSTVADFGAFWPALFGGGIVSPDRVITMVSPRSGVPADSMRYGLGFWLHESNSTVMLEGFDAGVSFRTVHNPETKVTHTVISNTSHGAWPITRQLAQLL